MHKRLSSIQPAFAFRPLPGRCGRRCRPPGLPDLGPRAHKYEHNILILAGIRTPAKNMSFAWLVENKGDPKKAKKEKGELIWGSYSLMTRYCCEPTEQNKYTSAKLNIQARPNIGLGDCSGVSFAFPSRLKILSTAYASKGECAFHDKKNSFSKSGTI